MYPSIDLRDDRSEKVHYDHPDYPFSVRYSLLSSYPNYTAPLHFHDDIELIAVLGGEMNYHVNGSILTLKEKEGILINSRQMHFGFSDTKTECTFICVILHPMLLCTTPSYEQDFVLPLINNPNAAFVKLHAGTEWQHQIWEQVKIIYEMKNKKTAPLNIQSAFLTIWTLLYENTPIAGCRKNRQNTDLTILKNMVGFIQKKYAEKITLQDIASAGAVGQSKCCKIFAAALGQTPNGYLNQYRLNKSARLLKDTDMSVTQIACAVGFTGTSYYSESFRRWLGKSPTEYRKTR